MSLDPILVAAPPRSGTSMVAGLLHQHGVQVGSYNKTKGNPKGAFEELSIKKFIKHTLKQNGYDIRPTNIMPSKFKDDLSFRSNILNIAGNPKGLWLFKESRILMTWPLWAKHFPDSLYVLVHRNSKDTINSMKRRLKVGEYVIYNWLEWGRARQKEIAKYCPHVWIDADSIWEWDLGEVKKLVECCGLVFNEEATKNWIDPQLWSNRKGI